MTHLAPFAWRSRPKSWLMCATACAACMCAMAAQAGDAPRYTIDLLGPGTVINAMNDRGEIVGWTVDSGAVQAFITGPDHPHELLPLPAGYTSAWAQGINNAGVVVGSVGTGSPEFGKAAAWRPNESGGYDIELLGQLPGHTQSVAYAINNHGDIVGESIRPGWQGGPTVWFNSPEGVMDISSLGAPSSPKDISDQRVVAGINGPLFDLDALEVIPLPEFNAPVIGAHIWGLNNQNELAGAANVGGSMISAVRWTHEGGWEVLGGIFNRSANVLAFDISDDKTTVMETAVVGWFSLRPAAHFDGVGLFPLEELVEGRWAFVPNWGEAVNNVGQIASIAVNLDTNESGVVILTPVSHRANLIDFAMLDGQLISGGLPQLMESDDSYLETEARVTGEVHQPHLLRMRMTAETDVQNAAALSVAVEGRITDVEAQTTLLLRDWINGGFEQVDQFSMTMTEDAHETIVPQPADYIRAADGVMRLEIRQIVFFPFTLNGFHTLLDQVEVVLR